MHIHGINKIKKEVRNPKETENKVCLQREMFLVQIESFVFPLDFSTINLHIELTEYN